MEPWNIRFIGDESMTMTIGLSYVPKQSSPTH